MDYQAGLPTDNPTYLDHLHSHEKEDVYLLLGVEPDGYGHYYMGSHQLHSVVVRVNDNYTIEEGMDWLAPSQVTDYIEHHDLQGLSQLAQMHLEHHE